MSHMGNPHQTRIGTPSHAGPAFPETESGDEVICYAAPAHWPKDCHTGVVLAVNLHVATLTPREARVLATALMHHANMAEFGDQA